MSQKISIVLATFNEEKNINDCLTSVRDLADEIIVVDGNSQDQTRILARAFGAKIYRCPNVAIFHKNKQIAVNKATRDWILQLDADERITAELTSEMRRVINEKNQLFSGFYLPRKNWFLGRFLTKGGQYPDYVIRLFRRGKGKFPAKTVHEQIEISGQVGYLKSPIIHMADPTFSRYLQRFNRYTSLDAQLLQERKVKPTLWFGLQSFIMKPLWWFFLTFFRHKGFVDGFPGFVFALMSSLRFPVIFMKLWELDYQKRNLDLTKDWS